MFSQNGLQVLGKIMAGAQKLRLYSLLGSVMVPQHKNAEATNAFTHWPQARKRGFTRRLTCPLGSRTGAVSLATSCGWAILNSCTAPLGRLFVKNLAPDAAHPEQALGVLRHRQQFGVQHYAALIKIAAEAGNAVTGGADTARPGKLFFARSHFLHPEQSSKPPAPFPVVLRNAPRIPVLHPGAYPNVRQCSAKAVRR